MGGTEEAGRQVSQGARERRRMRRRTLAVGVALLAAAVVVTLAQDAERRTGTNGFPARVFLGTATGPTALCQADERVPARTAALRFSAIASAHAAPRLTVTVRRGGGVRARGTRARWEGENAIVVPFERPLRTTTLAEVCVRLHADERQTYGFKGTRTYLGEGASKDGEPLPALMHVEYLAGGQGPWWSFAPTITRRLGRGHAWSGASVALLAALLTLTSIAVGAWQLSRADS